MAEFFRKYKGSCIFPLLITLAVAVLFFDVEPICAHTPHDVIDALALSPSYDQDKTLFIAMAHHVRKSTDGGFSWKELLNGLTNKFFFSSIAISPSFHVDKTLFASSTGDGIYRSQDGGTSWLNVNNGLDDLNIGLLSLSSVYYDKIVLAAGSEGGLYKTKDGGESWYQVIDDLKITAIAFSPEPKKGHILAGDHAGNLYLSMDSGETWQQHFRSPNSGAITSIAISPNVLSDSTFFIGTEKRGVFRTVDGGASFVEINKGLPDQTNIRSLAISPEYETDTTIFASTWYEAAFCSNDGGNTWKKYGQGVTWDQQADSEKYRSPHFRDLRISKTFGKDRTLFLAGFDGLFKSTDAGQNWTQMETLPVRLIMDLSISPGDKDNSSVAITTYGGGAYITHDQGLTWTISNSALDTTRLSGIAFSSDYHADNTIFSASRGWLLKSTDRGNAWDKISIPYKNWRNSLAAVLRKLGLRRLTGRILTKQCQSRPFPTVIALSPNFASDKTLYFGTRNHGIFKSVDGGMSSSVVWGEWEPLIASLVISPDFPSDKTLFASIRGGGIIRTVDGGDSWQPANNGLTFLDAWRKAPEMPHLDKTKDPKLAISPHYKVDKTVFVASSFGVFKTTDGGDSWQELEGVAGDRESHYIGIAVSPNYKNDQTLMVSLKGKGLFKSENKGFTFAEIAPDLINNNHEITMIGFSASYAVDNTIYAAYYEELFQSTDGGNTWKVIARPVRYENMRIQEVWAREDTVIYYDGQWEVASGDGFSATTVSQSDISHNKATLNFVGGGVRLIGTKSNDQGIAKVYIDGNYEADVDQFSDSRETMVEAYSVTGLPYGPHTITIEVTNMKNPNSTGYRVEIDAFDVLP